MMRAWLILMAAAALVAGCTAHRDDPAAAALQDAGTALVAATGPASASEGLFQSHCAMCHADGKLYPGTVQLRASGQARPALASRTDLDADYVRQVARHGLGSMPPLTPTQLSDADLDRIAQWLATKK